MCETMDFENTEEVELNEAEVAEENFDVEVEDFDAEAKAFSVELGSESEELNADDNFENVELIDEETNDIIIDDVTDSYDEYADGYPEDANVLEMFEESLDGMSVEELKDLKETLLQNASEVDFSGEESGDLDDDSDAVYVDADSDDDDDSYGQKVKVLKR